MNFKQEAKQLLSEINPGLSTSSAYDTAWVARLVKHDPTLGNGALDWLRANQLEGGMWGAERLAYYHDRVVCTLAAMIALSENGAPEDIHRVEQAKQGLYNNVERLSRQSLAETVGAEIIIPTLLDEAEALGLIERWEDPEIERLQRQRERKFSLLPEGGIHRDVTLAFSAEMAGRSMNLLDVDNMQEANGSIGVSPAATAYFARFVKPGNPEALSYLREHVKPGGSFPTIAPFDLYEIAWTLLNLHLSGTMDDELLALAEPHLDFLERHWNPTNGVGFAADYAISDSDDTSLVYEVLERYGRDVNLEPVLNYEEQDFFRCFELELNLSFSANIHVLGALRAAGVPATDPAVQKVKRLLQSAQFWFDKWHISPYYPTTHAIMAGVGLTDDIFHDAIKWILETQKPDGSWGYFDSTAEETAYCIQALMVWKSAGYDVDANTLINGIEWLKQHGQPPYTRMWVGKCLYAPTWVIRSAVVSAIQMVEQAVSPSL